jgi:hypothetical protein
MINKKICRGNYSMDRYEIEMVLEKSLAFWKENLKENVNLVDIHALANKIWKDIQFEINVREKIIEFTMSKSQLLSLEKNGDIGLILDDDTQINIGYLDDTESIALTESGKIIVLDPHDERRKKNDYLY